jgi:hypothetical protein
MDVSSYRQLVLCILWLFATLVASAENEKPPQPGSGNEAAANAVAENTRLDQQMAATLGRIAELIARQCNWCTQDGEYLDLGADLETNQVAWKSWAEAECELLYKLEGPGWNQWTTARAVQCMTQQSQMRLKRLSDVEHCLAYERDTDNSKDFRTCVRNLTPHLDTP